MKIQVKINRIQGRIFLYAFPTGLERDKQGEITSKDELNKGYSRLKKLYKNCGFQQINNTHYFTKDYYDK